MRNDPENYYAKDRRALIYATSPFVGFCFAMGFGWDAIFVALASVVTLILAIIAWRAWGSA